MEIEGLINHTLKAFEAEKNYIADKYFHANNNIKFWETIKAIHANEGMRDVLKGVTHIRQIIGREDCMKELLSAEEEISTFKGFPLKIIEFYIHLIQQDGIEKL